MPDIWNDKLGIVARASLEPYDNIEALFRAMPYNPNNTALNGVGNKLTAALTNEGIIDTLDTAYAARLNSALSDPAVRAQIVRMAQSNPQALNNNIDRLIANPERTGAILAAAQPAQRQAPANSPPPVARDTASAQSRQPSAARDATNVQAGRPSASPAASSAAVLAAAGLTPAPDAGASAAPAGTTASSSIAVASTPAGQFIQTLQSRPELMASLTAIMGGGQPGGQPGGQGFEQELEALAQQDPLIFTKLNDMMAKPGFDEFVKTIADNQTLREMFQDFDTQAASGRKSEFAAAVDALHKRSQADQDFFAEATARIKQAQQNHPQALAQLAQVAQENGLEAALTQMDQMAEGQERLTTMLNGLLSGPLGGFLTKAFGFIAGIFGGPEAIQQMAAGTPFAGIVDRLSGSVTQLARAADNGTLRGVSADGQMTVAAQLVPGARIATPQGDATAVDIDMDRARDRFDMEQRRASTDEQRVAMNSTGPRLNPGVA